jgi:hypothetical protein
MLLARFNKQPREVRKFVIDYSNRLGTAEFLTTIVAVEIEPLTDPILGIATAISADNLSVLVYVSGGVNGQEYKIDIRVTTTDGGVIWEDEMLFLVEEI